MLPLIFSAYLRLMGGSFSMKVTETQEGAETPEVKCEPSYSQKVLLFFLSLKSPSGALVLLISYRPG